METNNNISELVIERRDLDIFKIEDEKTRLETLQSYFFPKLSYLVNIIIEMAKEIYDIDFTDFSIVKKPDNRKKAAKIYLSDAVHMGLSGKRCQEKDLIVYNRAGKLRKFPTFYLIIELSHTGEIQVVLLNQYGIFSEAKNKKLRERIHNELKKYSNRISCLLSTNHIAHSGAFWGETVFSMFKNPEIYEDFGEMFFGPIYYLPVSMENTLNSIIMQFIALLPILHTFIQMEKGQESQLGKLLDDYFSYMKNILDSPDLPELVSEDRNKNQKEVELDWLESTEDYKLIRPGLWWQILARDNWTCVSCGRTAHDGIVLHVDHIIPRSKGGTNDPQNLQALCRKCNIGKSNKDIANLRNGPPS